MKIGVSFATTVETPEHIRIAESLGYTRAFVFSSPAIYVDAFMVLGLAAERTERIDLGPCVMIPHLRHVADAAAALATLYTLAPGRVTAVVGSGFSSTALLNRKPVPWATVEKYVAALRDLLGGREVEWDETSFGLLYTGANGIKLPIELPIWLAAHGPKGFKVAENVGDGVITNPTHGDQPIPFAGYFAIQFYGTVLDEGEAADSTRAIAATGPGAALALHMGQFGPVAGLEEEVGFAATLAQVPESRRLIETHRTHMLELSKYDRPYITERVIRQGTMTGSAAEVRDTLKRFEGTGASEFIYSPMGPDIPRELEAFAAAVGL